MGSASRDSAHILVVDDEPAVVEFADRALQGAGYKTTTATSGQAAVQICEEQGCPDLLLTDLRMPQMAGDELASRLRQRDPDLKVLYISGYAQDSDAIERALRSGDAFLAKPFTVGNLARQVRDVLDRSE